MKFGLAVFFLGLMITPSMAQNNNVGDYMYCAHQMLSLIPIFEKIGTAALESHKHWRTIADQVPLLEGRIKQLSAYCGLIAPNMTNISTSNSTVSGCGSAATTFYQIAQPMIGHPTSVTQDLQIFQQLLDQLPNMKASCGDIDPFSFSNEESSFEDSLPSFDDNGDEESSTGLLYLSDENGEDIMSF